MLAFATELRWIEINASEALLGTALYSVGDCWRSRYQDFGKTELLTHLKSMGMKLMMLMSTGEREQDKV